MSITIGITENNGSASGGSVYERMVSDALSQKYDIQRLTPKHHPWARSRLADMIINGQTLSTEPDVLILTVNAAAFLNWSRHKGQKIVLIWHHYDANAFASGRPALRILYKHLFHRILKRASQIARLVVVGEYWSSYFAKFSFPSIDIIYNAFDLNKIRGLSASMSRDAWRNRLNLRGECKAIYMGQLQKLKGATDIWRSLGASAGIRLIGSGRKDIDVPVEHFTGTYDEYLQMLGACDVALSMSRMYEGWNRTAHEAMLMGTPVVGNAIGNSGELLRGAGQIVCQNYYHLPRAVDVALANREMYRERAMKFAYAEKYSLEFFQEQWIALADSLVSNA
jgi:glycosyltransferase involved in cell wall biosynthesis